MLQTNTWQNYKWIIGAALLVRLVAVLFSPGYGMHDDHFLIIESSSSWANGADYNHWLPWSEGNTGKPEGHSFTYGGLNFLYFYFMKMIGVVDPKILMLINRLIHGLVSMLVVIYGIKITEKLSTVKNAKIVGWFLGVLWIVPFLSVRNLVETAAIPFLILGVWFLVRERTTKDFLWAGIIIGFAVSFRYQIGVFAIGIAAIYFFRYQWNSFFQFCAGVLLMFILTQGVVDYTIWGYPFAELWAYVMYNMNEGTGYLPNENYFMYFLVLMGVMLVPMGILLMFGFVKSWKKYALLFVPTVIFILFHTLYPNRQERFILTILPFFIILGVVGYELLRESNLKMKLWKFSWIAFWVLNIPFLIFASTMYSKKSRVEAMYSIYANGMNNEMILMEGSTSGSVSMMPKFYSGDWTSTIMERTDPNSTLKVDDRLDYDYILFCDEKDLQKRIKQYLSVYPDMQLFKKCEPSLLDKLLRELNPRNANEYIEVWKTNR